MTGTTIRRVDISDEIVREQLHLLMGEIFSGDDWDTGRVPRYKTGYWWIAFVGGEPAALAGMLPSARLPETGYLCAAGVLPRFRGRGLQKVLVRRRVRYAADLGWHTVVTDTLHDNAASMRSLIACGFRPYRPSVLWGDPDHAVYWTRSTTSPGRKVLPKA